MLVALLTSEGKDLALAIAIAVVAIGGLAMARSLRNLRRTLDETEESARRSAARLDSLLEPGSQPEFAPVGPGPAGGPDLVLRKNRHGDALATVAPDRVTMIVENRGAGSAQRIRCRVRDGRAAVEGGLSGAEIVRPGEQGVLAFPIGGSRLGRAISAGNEIVLELSFHGPGEGPEQRYRAAMRPIEGASHWPIENER